MINKKTITIAIVILIGVVATLFYTSQGTSNTEDEDQTIDTSRLYTAANDALREHYGDTIPYDRPMHLEEDLASYGDGWFSALITTLDENPRNYERTMVFVFKKNDDSLEVVEFQPKGWFEEERLPSNIPEDLKLDLIGEPHGDE